MNRRKEIYMNTVVPAFLKEGVKNAMAVPRISKVVLSVGVGTKEANQKTALEQTTAQMTKVTGQKPKSTAARTSIAGFNVREGQPVGIMVTMRGQRMWEFLDKLIGIVLPKLKDFQGVPLNAFDQNGNYNLGLAEQIVFPEVDYDTIDRVRGLQITIVTSTHDRTQAHRLLELLGMPFAKEAGAVKKKTKKKTRGK